MAVSSTLLPNEDELFFADEAADEDSRTSSTLLPNEDELFFADEEAADEDSSSAAWKILLVDDDKGVHQVTQLALKFFTFENRHLEFISAYSAREAKRLIANHADIALVLLDVIMETHDAGLIVAKYIREEIRNKAVRIVLRTGQPGESPEEDVVVKYDINDYKTKTELTQQKLFTTLVSSLRAYRDLLALEQSYRKVEALNAELQQFNHNLEDLVELRTQELAQKNQQLQHEIAERHKAENALRIYIHALTHDLKNPVSGMAGILRNFL
ncbi:MAG: response regulator, partial [Pseudanabaenales cyanobacterium]|nr:response regulator [Pseudanabaenales cyanobacterium]